MYAKLENNTLIPAPSEIDREGFRVYNPTAEHLKEFGYKEVVYPQPSDTTAAPDTTPQTPVYTEDADHIYVSYIDAAPAPVPDPVTLREAAYRAEADQFLTAYEGYLLEGKSAQAEEQKALYLARKAEIRAQYPDKTF
ncbi:MAG: hypothetical protein RRY33_08390 [Alistipes sp.]